MPDISMVVAGATLGGLVGTATCPLMRRLSRSDSPLRMGWFSWVIVPAVTAVVYGMMVWRIGWSIDLPAYAVVGALAAPVSAIDITEQRIPNVLLAVAYPLMLGGFGLAAAVHHDGPALVRAVAGMVTVSTGYLLLAITRSGGIGGGDVKLAGLVGLMLGWRSWPAVLAGVLAGLLLGAVVGLAMIACSRATRSTPIPFSPAMLAGALIVAVGTF